MRRKPPGEAAVFLSADQCEITFQAACTLRPHEISAHFEYRGSHPPGKIAGTTATLCRYQSGSQSLHAGASSGGIYLGDGRRLSRGASMSNGKAHDTGIVKAQPRELTSAELRPGINNG